MAKAFHSSQVFRFGAFEFDVRVGELRKEGRKVKLQEQPGQILASLLQSPGEMVTREELRQKLWPSDTFVDFDHGLNTAVKKLRVALNDDADAPRYVETIPRRGYRLITAVEKIDAGRPRRQRRRLWVVAGISIAALILAVLSLTLWNPRPPIVRSEWVRLTAFPASATSPSLSRDGRMLAFVRGEGTFYTAGEIYVKALPDGEPVQLTQDGQFKMSPAFSPDGTRIAYTTVDSRSHNWDAWVVPVLGGQPRLLLSNASGLTWVGDQRVMFSQIDRGLHMAIVTAAESRAQLRDVYVPPARPEAMAHRSYLSPDGKWVLVAEMEEDWLPCRLVPFDGRSQGRQVGPRNGSCTSAAWSPDGKWMYFSSDASGSFHIWRQQFPDGEPEQITFGPTEEEGVAVAPDGHSLITSVGIQQRSVWLHDTSGERRVSSEGYAFLPRFGTAALSSCFSPDGKKLYYLVKRDPSDANDAGELWAAHLESGRTYPALPDFLMTAFDISRDENRIVFSSFDEKRNPRIWLASLDGRYPPRQLAPLNAYSPRFASDGTIVFRVQEGGQNFIYRVGQDGSGLQRVSPVPIAYIHSVSPDGQWVIADVRDDVKLPSAVAFPILGGLPRKICSAWCAAQWAADGRFFYVTLEGTVHERGWKTFVIPVSRGKLIPDLPSSGIQSEADLAGLPIERIIERRYISPGPDPSRYAFSEGTMNRNLYRIPVP